jgi:hypothetical protein
MKPSGPASARLPPHVFEIVFNPFGASHPEAGGSPFRGRRVIVEVTDEAPTLRLAREAHRPFAAEVAHGAALQAVQKDLPHGVEPACSVTLLEGLPDGFGQQRPALYTGCARAWLA